MAKKWSPLLQTTPGDGCIKSQTSLVPCNLQCPYRASSLILTHLDHTYDNQHYDVHINAEKDDRGLILMYLRLDKVWCCKSSTSSVDATPPCVCASTRLNWKRGWMLCHCTIVDAIGCHPHVTIWCGCHTPLCANYRTRFICKIMMSDRQLESGDFEFWIVSDIIISCLNTLLTN